MANYIKDKKILITSGPTFEYIDPVRFISNRSSGKQGFLIAKEISQYCDNVNLITSISYPKELLPNVNQISVTSGLDMHKAALSLLPVDIAICVAAVSDWRPEKLHNHKLKKFRGQNELILRLVKNPDILADIAQNYENRPKLVVGFSAETESIVENSKQKLIAKECDWLLTSDVSKPELVFDSPTNQIYFTTREGQTELWELMNKEEIAKILLQKIQDYFESFEPKKLF